MRSSARPRPRRTAAVAGALAGLAALVAGVLALPGADAAPVQEGGALDLARPRTVTAADTEAVELGLTFTSGTGGTALGVQFFKGPQNTGVHTGTLWSADGARLASVRFSGETAAGWQQALFATPVTLAPGATYVVSYSAPRGRYAADAQVFTAPRTRNTLTVPAGGGVYSYGVGRFPRSTWNNTNYYVDVVFAPTSTPGPTSPTPGTPVLSLPKVPSEGADYWTRFAKTDAAGWDDPSFFPIGVWWSVASSPEEVAFDRSLGLNTYVLTNPAADYRLIEDGGMYWVGGQLPGATAASKNWVGSFLDDEVDGRFPPAEGLAEMKRLADGVPPATTGRFRYANYTSSLVTYDRDAATRDRYVNAFTDAVSLDQYFYGVPQCDWGADALRWATPVGYTAITPANCRTSSSYGKMISLLRESDATDGRRQPVWALVEVVGEPNRLDGAQVQGAAMNSIIHGAGGIVWFPQAFTGGCETGNAFRTYQVSKASCLAAQVEGARKINLLVRSLAPVIKGDTYAWTFGPGIDSMLKVHDGTAYVFAMTRDGGTGRRTFTLPAGVNGAAAEVVGEGRSVRVSNGVFSDDFARESTYHVYRIPVAR